MPRKNNELLSETEELVFRALLHLGGVSYGVPIHETLQKVTGKFISIGAIYAALERMKDEGFVTSRIGEATAERGGRAKKFFKAEGAAIRALKEADRVRAALKPRGKARWEPIGGTL